MSEEAWSRALESLVGLAVGDAFGNRFNERTPAIAGALLRREAPPRPWRYSDDTLMACSVVAVLQERGNIDAERLAESFVAGYAPDRGYGPKMREILEAARAGASVRAAAARLFGGRGSFGNGAVMRLPPLGAYYAGDPERAAREGMESAAVTHTHREAIAGARAIAVAAALFAASRGSASIATRSSTRSSISFRRARSAPPSSARATSTRVSRRSAPPSSLAPTATSRARSPSPSRSGWRRGAPTTSRRPSGRRSRPAAIATPMARS